MDAGFVNVWWVPFGGALMVNVSGADVLGLRAGRSLTPGDRIGISWMEPNCAAARVIVAYHGNRSDAVDGFDPDVTVTCDGPVQLTPANSNAAVAFRTHAATVTVWGMDRRWRRETTDEPGDFEWTTTGPRFAKVLEVER